MSSSPFGSLETLTPSAHFEGRPDEPELPLPKPKPGNPDQPEFPGFPKS